MRRNYVGLETNEKKVEAWCEYGWGDGAKKTLRAKKSKRYEFEDTEGIYIPAFSGYIKDMNMCMYKCRSLETQVWKSFNHTRLNRPIKSSNFLACQKKKKKK